MTGIVYILYSLKDQKTYTGSTDNLERRLLEHQSGKVLATKNRLPIKLIYTENFNTIEEARKREHYYKSCSGRKKLKTIINSLIERFKSLASIRERMRVEAGPPRLDV